jgi:hypothetical protein
MKAVLLFCVCAARHFALKAESIQGPTKIKRGMAYQWESGGWGAGACTSPEVLLRSFEGCVGCLSLSLYLSILCDFVADLMASMQASISSCCGIHEQLRGCREVFFCWKQCLCVALTTMWRVTCGRCSNK